MPGMSSPRSQCRARPRGSLLSCFLMTKLSVVIIAREFHSTQPWFTGHAFWVQLSAGHCGDSQRIGLNSCPQGTQNSMGKWITHVYTYTWCLRFAKETGCVYRLKSQLESLLWIFTLDLPMLHSKYLTVCQCEPIRNIECPTWCRHCSDHRGLRDHTFGIWPIRSQF